MREIKTGFPSFISKIWMDIVRNLKNSSSINVYLNHDEIYAISELFAETQKKIPNYVDTTSYFPENFEDVLIVGDIHGDFDVMKRIITPFVEEKVKSVIFLGDYVDRGKRSFDCLITVVVLSILFPERIIALRGNHEELEMNSRYGFMRELKKLFGRREQANLITLELDHIYNHLSLAAKTPQRSICVHAGIAKGLKRFQDLNKISKPHNDYNNILKMKKEQVLDLYGILEQIRWNDPSEKSGSEFESSFRGWDYFYFNLDALKPVLKSSGGKRLIRAHESTRGGFERMFDGLLLHVFSSEPYFGTIKKAYIIHETKINGINKTFLRDLDFNLIREIK